MVYTGGLDGFRLLQRDGAGVDGISLRYGELQQEVRTVM